MVAGDRRGPVSAPSLIRVLLADHQQIYLVGLVAVLSSMSFVQVVGECADAGMAIALAAQLRPHVMLVAGELPDGGVDRVLAAEVARGARVIVLAGDADPEAARAWIEAGARGYVLRRRPRQHLFQVIRAVVANEVHIDSSVVEAMICREPRGQRGPRPVRSPGGPAPSTATPESPRSAQSDPPPPPPPGAAPAEFAGCPQCFPELFADLTRRQREVAALVARGLTNSEIAARLDLSPATVKSHVRSTLRALELRDRTQLAVLAHRGRR